MRKELTCMGCAASTVERVVRRAGSSAAPVARDRRRAPSWCTRMVVGMLCGGERNRASSSEPVDTRCVEC